MALAAAQHGVFNLEQLAALGLSERAAQRRVETGRLRRVFDGVYALSPALTVDGRRMSAVLSVAPRAFLSHRTAAVAHGILGGDGRRGSSRSTTHAARSVVRAPCTCAAAGAWPTTT